MAKQPPIPETNLQPHELKRENLAALIQVAERLGYTVSRYFPRGIPAFEMAEIELEGAAAHAGEAIQQLMGVSGLQMNFRIFPRGIIATDAVRIAIEATSAVQS